MCETQKGRKNLVGGMCVWLQGEKQCVCVCVCVFLCLCVCFCECVCVCARMSVFFAHLRALPLVSPASPDPVCADFSPSRQWPCLMLYGWVLRRDNGIISTDGHRCSLCHFTRPVSLTTSDSTTHRNTLLCKNAL